jgi:hypothetical protein
MKMNFRFEHRRQKVVPLGQFLKRVFRYTMFSGSLIVFSVLIGSLGYHFIGKLMWLDSFHMSCMILTGMGPVAEMKSDSAKIFSSLFALYSGVAFLSITAVFFAPIVHRVLHMLQVEPDENPEPAKMKNSAKK